MSGETSKQPSESSTGITWGPWAAVLIVIVVYIVAQYVGLQLTAIYPLIKHWSHAMTDAWLTSSIIAQFSYVVIAEALSIGLVAWFIRRRKGSFKAIGLKHAKWEDLGYALIGFVAYFTFYIVVVVILSNLIKGLQVSQTQDVGFSQTTTGWPLVLIFISLVVLPAIAEEFLFRGFLFSGLKKALPTVWAIGLTSLIFASPHLLESSSGGLLWIAGIDTFVLSAVLCVLREKTGRLYAGMGVHGLKNFIAFFALFIAPHLHLVIF